MAAREGASYRKEGAGLGYNDIANLAMPVPAHLHHRCFTCMLLQTLVWAAATRAAALMCMQNPAGRLIVYLGVSGVGVSLDRPPGR